MTMLLLFISIAPVFILAFYIYSKDTVKEPMTLLLGLFASGFLSAVIVTIVYIIMSLKTPDIYLINNYKELSNLKLFSMVFLEIALIEEFSKWLMIRIIGYNHKDFDQLYDIIVYSVFVALGFALVENIFYVLPNDLSLGIYRAVFSVPGHACFGVFMGVFLGLAKLCENKNKPLYILYMISAVLIPTFFHTIYNFCLMTKGAWFSVIFVIFVIILYISTIIEVNKVSEDNEKIKKG